MIAADESSSPRGRRISALRLNVFNYPPKQRLACMRDQRPRSWSPPSFRSSVAWRGSFRAAAAVGWGQVSSLKAWDVNEMPDKPASRPPSSHLSRLCSENRMRRQSSRCKIERDLIFDANAIGGALKVCDGAKFPISVSQQLTVPLAVNLQQVVCLFLSCSSFEEFIKGHHQ